MKPQEHIELDRKNQTDISQSLIDEKMPGLGVQVSKDLWENTTVELRQVNMLELQSFPVADVKELVHEGNIVFARCDELEENIFPCRVQFCDTTEMDTLMKFNPYKEDLSEISISWKNDTHEIKYGEKTPESFITFYPAPDIDLLLELEAYSLAASINI